MNLSCGLGTLQLSISGFQTYLITLQSAHQQSHECLCEGTGITQSDHVCLKHLVLNSSPQPFLIKVASITQYGIV